MMFNVMLDTSLQQGLIYVIAVWGVVISFRLMDFPDLSIDSTFTLGGAIMAVSLVKGQSVLEGLFLAVIGGFIAGTITAMLYRKLGISKILSGILIMLILYSVNLRIMGKANISLLRYNTLFSPFDSVDKIYLLFFLGFIAIILLLVLLYLSITKIGLFIRATGDNEFMVKNQGVNTNYIYYIGIGLSNALISFSGALVAQNQGFVDISMGIGLIITALASLIIGESFVLLFLNIKNKLLKNIVQGKQSIQLPWDTFNEFIAALIGSILYFFIIALCLQLGLVPTDLKLATGILVILGISLRFKSSLVGTYQKSKL